MIAFSCPGFSSCFWPVRRPDRRGACPGHAPITLETSGTPGPLIDKVYVGHWFSGRPSAYQLWEDLQDLFRRIKPDFEPTLAEGRAAWEATRPVA